MKQAKVELLEILNDNGFWYEMDELKYSELELVQKASGDSYERSIEDVFGKDCDKFKRLCKKLNITYPEYVWFD